MDPQRSRVSHVFRELAAVFEAFERTETGFDVTHATPVDEDLLDTCTLSVEIGTRIPFLEHGFADSKGKSGPPINLSPTDVSLDRDGSLCLELHAEVDCGPDSTTVENAQPDVSRSNLDEDRDAESDVLQESEDPQEFAPITNGDDQDEYYG